MQVTDTIRNGVDTEQLFGTLDAVKAQPELAAFTFRVSNEWIDGAHNRSTIKDFYAACQEDTSRDEAFTADAGEPAILLRHRHRPEPGRVPAARPRRLPDDVARLRRRGAQGAADRASSRRSRATWTCGARSAWTTTSPTASRTSASRSPSRATPPTRSCARSSRARRSPLRRLRHAHDRRARPRGRRHPLIGTPHPAGTHRARPGPTPPARRPPMPIQLSARTRSGADLVALAEQLAAELAVAAPRARPRRQLPLRGDRRAAARPLLHRPGARASSAASASTRCTTSSSPPRASPAATPRSPSA